MADFRLGVVGIDGSHCYNFSQIINREEGLGARVVHCFSAGDSEKEQNAAKILEDLGAERVEKLEDVAGKVDAVLVTPYNHVRNNYPLARPFLEAGIHTYADKVLATHLSEAKHMVALAEENGSALMSDSALRWAPEVLLADALGRHGKPVNLVLGHHTGSIGGSAGSRLDTIWPQVKMLTDVGVPAHRAEKLIRKNAAGN